MESEASVDGQEEGSQQQQQHAGLINNKQTARIVFWVAALAVIGLCVYFRVPMLQYYGLYEPDGYFHYSVIRAAVLHMFSIPQYMNLSGWPPASRIPHHSPFGLYWTTLVPYFFLRFLGVSYYDIMRLTPIAFGVIDVLLAYVIARNLSKDKLFGLLVMFLVAMNMGNAARTSALIYRGDSFVTTYLLLALICTIEFFKVESFRKKMMYTGATAFSLALAFLVWTGAAFAVAIYILAFVVILAFAFAFERRELIRDTRYMLVVLGAWFVLVRIFTTLRWVVSGPTFTGSEFFYAYVPMLVGWYAAHYITNKRAGQIPFLNTPAKRLALSLSVPVVALAFIYLFLPSLFNHIFVDNGLLVSDRFTTTIQEQQLPSYDFLFASFGWQNYTSPMNLIIILSTYYHGLIVELWIIMLLVFAPYFFMRVEHLGEGFLSGKTVWKFEFNASLLILLSYYAITAYLQMVAIRFNSLLSIPLSIFGAFTIYWLMLFLKRYRYAFYASFVLLLLLMVYVFNTDSNYIAGLSPADQVNPDFIHALAWLRNNSVPSSVVLTLWPDGSVVEGVANLTSVTDSVGSQFANKSNAFAAWLYNSSPDPAFLLGPVNGKPDYLLVRQAWMTETGGIFTESGINVSSNRYGYNPFSSLNERVNQTTQTYQFFGSGLEEDTIISNNSGKQTISSYLKFNNGLQPFGYIDFYNVVNGDYAIIKQTAFNVTNNQTFLITYSPIAAPKLYVNITAAYMLNTDLANSNMIKFLFHCGPNSCLWNNNVASMQLVYVNRDTKIFKIAYNQSNSAVIAATAAYPR